MTNLLERVVLRPLRPSGGLLPGDIGERWGDEEVSDTSDVDLWADLEEIGADTPILAAYVDSYRGWYLAFADQGPTQCIWLRPEPDFDPAAGWSVAADVDYAVVEDLARAFGRSAGALQDEIDTLDTREIFVNGAMLADVGAWERACGALAASGVAPPDVVLCDPADGGRRWCFGATGRKIVTHHPEPPERWHELQKHCRAADPEMLFRAMIFGMAK